ncbi:LysR family transcriptional regulator [Alisedimentitalea sp. MJ-SS2]|uniref:LysR family transcriptional regulator n=1 Tax=Aliisedimentitalea sp. MJ-SS2 TaxID=3049795 RepID=UPI002915AECE|nr:LysR family transcriptional regulator [Alisedimentitalea sp. MJ-SS2]MDU8928687.1 LysR family transcriptional regulator [Alisedimentitalea sp. MJ-SS2]
MSSRFTLRQLEYFVAVGRAGSVVEAAERVNVSSPSISTAISQLEQALGLPLFVRRRAQGLSLTQAGRQMMEQAGEVLAQAEALARLAGDIAGEVRGPLTLGCLLSFAQIIVPGLRRGFENLYPDVAVRQRELDQEGIFAGLRRAEIDVALSYDMGIPADLEFVPLVPLHPFAMMAVDHPLTDRDAVTVEELRPHPMILLDLPYSSEYFLSFFTARGTQPVIAERTRDMAVMRSLVANGYGYSIATIRPLNDRAPDGTPLRFVPLEGAVEPMQLGLVMAKGATSVLTLRAFIDHAKAYVAGGHVPGIMPSGGGAV